MGIWVRDATLRTTVTIPDTAQTLIDNATALRPMVRGFQTETEDERRIPPALVDALREAGLYRMLAPRVFGGLELDILSCFRVVELLAEADGSVGWNVMNNAVQQVAALCFPDACVQEVFNGSPDQIIAGTLVPGGGKGRRVEGGYLVSGRWRFGSGCREAAWMMGNFDLEDEDPREAAGVYRVIFPIEDCTIIDTWDMTGMRGTGSHDWSVSEVFVPDHRVAYVPGRVFFNQWQDRWPGTLYALPTHAIVGPHHSMIATGIARAGIEALAEFAGSKLPRGRFTGLLRDQPHIQDWIGRAEAILGGGRAYRQAILHDVWETVDAGRPTTLEQRAHCRLAGSFAGDSARQAMDLVYRAGGTTATERKHRLAHSWRDLQVVGQAAAVNPDWYPVVGRVLLGLDPGSRLA